MKTSMKFKSSKLNQNCKYNYIESLCTSNRYPGHPATRPLRHAGELTHPCRGFNKRLTASCLGEKGEINLIKVCIMPGFIAENQHYKTGSRISYEEKPGEPETGDLRQY